MKIKAVILSCLMGVIVLSMCYGYGLAEPKGNKGDSGIGVVSVQRILRGSKRSTRYREKSAAQRDRIIAELDKLRAEIEADKAGLKTRKIGSSDYSALMKEYLVKQGNLQAQEEFYKQQIALEEQTMIGELYGDIVRETNELASQKGLDLVLVKDEFELAASSARELMQAIDTHKLLYSGGCVDITDEVMARVDEEK